MDKNSEKAVEAMPFVKDYLRAREAGVVDMDILRTIEALFGDEIMYESLTLVALQARQEQNEFQQWAEEWLEDLIVTL